MTATEACQSGRRGPLDPCPTPRHHRSCRTLWSAVFGTPWKVIPLRTLPGRGGNGVAQTWLLGTEEKRLRTLQLTLPTGKVLIQAEMAWPRESEDRCLGQDQAAERTNREEKPPEADPWLNTAGQGLYQLHREVLGKAGKAPGRPKNETPCRMCNWPRQ